MPNSPASEEALITALSDPATAARLLAAVAATTGSAVFRGVAGLLRRRDAGSRPARGDCAALDCMAALLHGGVAATPEQASRYVARILTGEVSTDAAASRLARKYRAAAHKTSFLPTNVNGRSKDARGILSLSTGETRNGSHRKPRRFPPYFRNGGRLPTSYRTYVTAKTPS